ncbi:hypothetical protein NFI96_020079 [Prochilodus magdalenae]|nr:hypothetical protein NFI96_020079 [Prochilodus magdalenae]
MPLLTHLKKFPWVTNVTLYGCLFAGGDLAQQRLSGSEEVDWSRTRNVAIVAFSFHGNFSFLWMRFLERRFPGYSVRMVLRKLLVDQTVGAPLATTAFYTGQYEQGWGDSQVEPRDGKEQALQGKADYLPQVCKEMECHKNVGCLGRMSFLEGKDDILEDWRKKFLNTYKTALMYWPFMQFLNFSLVPPYLRTTFTGCCAFVWATFLCFSLQKGDGTMTAAVDWIHQLNREAKAQETTKSK